MTSSTARTSSEYLPTLFCNHFSIIPSHLVCKMFSNYRGIEFALAVWRQEEKMHYGQFFVKCSRRPHNCAQLTLCRLLDEIDCEIYTTKKKHVQSVQNVVRYATLWRCCRRVHHAFSSFLKLH